MKKNVIILSEDVKFARMLELELNDIGVESVKDFANCDGEKYIVFDIDSINTADLPSYVDVKKIIGFTKNDFNLSGEYNQICEHILKRPFYVKDLLQLFGYVEGIKKNIRIIKPEQIEVPQTKLTLDADNKTVILGDSVIALSENEFSVLSLLYQNIGEVVDRATIDILLGSEDSNMSDVYICHLRRKIDNKLGLKLIYTIRGKGYMLKN